MEEVSKVKKGAEVEALLPGVWPGWGNVRVLRRNYRSRRGEIDWVLEEKCGSHWELVFVEIRSCSPKSGPGALALESIGSVKRRKIELTARIFLSQYNGPAQTLRFDILTYESGIWTHLKNAW